MPPAPSALTYQAKSVQSILLQGCKHRAAGVPPGFNLLHELFIAEPETAQVWLFNEQRHHPCAMSRNAQCSRITLQLRTPRYVHSLSCMQIPSDGTHVSTQQ